MPLPLLVEELLAAGARWIWLRDRDLPPGARRALALDLAARVARHGGALTVGADVALAAEVGAGVQLAAGGDVAAARRALGAAAPVGVSAHGLDEIRAAREAGVTGAKAPGCLAAGAAGVAVMGALMRGGGAAAAGILAGFRAEP